MTAPIRIGLAGLGNHGSRYARHLLRNDVPGATLTAVCRADETRGREFAVRHGLAFVGRPEDLGGHPDVDAVALVLRPDLHPAAALACVERNVPVLVEKPLAPNVADAGNLAKCVERAGAFLMVGQTLRLDAVVRRLRAERSSIGALRTVYVNQRFEPADRPWIDTPGCGGMFLNTGVHGFDLLRWLTGAEPVSVFAEAGRAVTRETEDQYAAIFRLDPGDVIAVVDNARSTHSRSGRIELVGESGQIWGDHIHRTMTRIEGRKRSDLGPIPDSPTVPRVLRSFVEAVRGGHEPEITVRDGLAVARMIEAAALSAREGRRVALEEVDSPR